MLLLLLPLLLPLLLLQPLLLLSLLLLLLSLLLLLLVLQDPRRAQLLALLQQHSLCDVEHFCPTRIVKER